MTLVLFGLDGASLENIGTVMRRVDLPTFRRLLKQGRASELLSVYPYVTAPAWTSIFSGVNPGKHGIFEMFDITKGEFRSSNMRDSDVPFLWDYLSWAGKKTLIMGVPFIHPAPEINGVFVTGRFAPKLSSFPRTIETSYRLDGYRYNDLPTTDEAVTEDVFQRGSRTIARRMIADLVKRKEESLALIDSQPWDAIIIVDSLPDELFHVSYDDSQLIDVMFTVLDDWLREILKRMKSDDQLLIVSDHGFSPVNRVFFVNEWLHTRGYLAKPHSWISHIFALPGINWNSLSSDSPTARIYRLVLTRFPRMNNLTKRRFKKDVLLNRLVPEAGSRSVAFNINEAVAWIRILDANRTATSTAESLMNELNVLKRQGVLKNVFRIEEIYHGKYLAQAPGEILIEGPEGCQLDTIRWNRGQLIGKPLITRKGIHKREGMMVTYGRDLHEALPNHTVYDVVPTILQAMGIPVPNFLDGISSFAAASDSRRPFVLQIPESP